MTSTQPTKDELRKNIISYVHKYSAFKWDKHEHTKKALHFISKFTKQSSTESLVNSLIYNFGEYIIIDPNIDVLEFDDPQVEHDWIQITVNIN